MKSRVLTTSKGVVIPCDIAADAPPAMKNLGSADLSFSSMRAALTATVALVGGGSEITSVPSDMEGVVAVSSGENASMSNSAKSGVDNSTDSTEANAFGFVAINERNTMDDVVVLLRKARLPEFQVESSSFN